MLFLGVYLLKIKDYYFIFRDTLSTFSVMIVKLINEGYVLCMFKPLSYPVPQATSRICLTSFSLKRLQKNSLYDSVLFLCPPM